MTSSFLFFFFFVGGFSPEWILEFSILFSIRLGPPYRAVSYTLERGFLTSSFLFFFFFCGWLFTRMDFRV